MDRREEIYQKLVKEYQDNYIGIYELSPRFGKSRLGIGFIRKYKFKKVLWVTPNVELKDVDIPKEFIKWRAKTLLNNTTIVTYNSLHKIKGKFDLIILDELQFMTTNNSKFLLNGELKAKSIIGLTGTISKDREKIDIYAQLKLKVIETVSIDDAVEDDIISDYQINVVECNLNAVDKNIEAKNKKTGKTYKMTEAKNYAQKDYMVNQALYSGRFNDKFKQFMILNRRRTILNSPTKHEIAKNLFNNLKGRILMFASSIKQAEELSKNTYHSKTNDEDLHKFINQKIDKLSCVNAGGTGFTYKNVDHFIIVQATNNKNGDTTQKMARSLLKQKNYTATIWIICLLGTQDEIWVRNALAEFDSNKITYINAKNLKL